MDMGTIIQRIWGSPRLVFSNVIEYPQPRIVLILMSLAGISNALDRASSQNLGEDMELIYVLLFSIILGALFGWISLFIYGHLLQFTGSWLKGQSKGDTLVHIVAHAMIPSIFGLIPMTMIIMIYGNSVFQAEYNINDTTDVIIFFVFGIIQLTLGIYTLVLTVIGIAEAQKFSIGKAVLNLFLPLFLLLIPVFLFLLIVEPFR